MRFIRAVLTTMVFTAPATVALADGCYICGGGSSCKQCRYGSKDTFDARKACEKKGCKVSGTTSCSTAANVKVCMAPETGPSTASVEAPADASIPWCPAA